MITAGGHRVHPAAIRRMAAACGLALLAAACNGDKKDGGTAGPTITVAPTTTSAPETPEEQVLDDYRKGWDAFLVALDPPNPQNPDFLRYTTGEALNQSKTYMLELQSGGLVGRGSFEFNASLRSLDGDRAVVWDCSLDRSFKYDAKTGELKDSPDPVKDSIQTEMVREGGVWKHARVTDQEGPCAGT